MQFKKLKLLNWFFIFCMIWMPFFSFAATPLPINQAFQLSVRVDNPEKAIATFQVAPGYFLYAKRLDFNFKPAIVNLSLPQGEFKYDQDRGRYEILSGNFNVPIQLHSKINTLNMQVKYQGCSQDGFCYPPTEKNFLLNFVNNSVTELSNVGSLGMITTNGLLNDQNQIQTLLHANHIGIILLLFTGIGLLLAFTPCVLPMIPILTSIIAGQKIVSTHKALMLSITYVLGSAISYAIAGLLAASLGNSLQVWLQQPIIIASLSTLFALLAFSLFGVYEIKLPIMWQQHLTLMSNKQQSGTYVGVFIMGMLSTLIVSPCVTAPLVGVLIYISQTGNLFLGASSLFMMGLGMGLPLILIGTSAGKWLPKSGAWMDGVKKTFGFLMLGMAIWLISRVLTLFIVHILWGAYLISIALAFAAYLPRLIGQHTLNRSIAGLIAALGLVVILSGIYPFSQKNSLPTLTPTFTVVHNIKDLNLALFSAKESHRPALLDFYADWCESCVTMDKQVFDKQTVRQALKDYVLVRADLSNNDSEEEALLKQYGVIAPPTVLFFNSEGKEINMHRIVGEVNANEFLNRLQIVVKTSCEKNVKC